MKIALRGGHSALSPGAVYTLNEYKEMQYLYYLLKRKFEIPNIEIPNIEIINCNSTEQYPFELNNGINKANESGADLFISLHMNASDSHQGHGTECWIYSENSSAKKLAEKICLNISEIGHNNRGVKCSTSFAELRKTKCPAVIVETCFCDNPKDTDIFDVEKLADAIFNAIVDVCHLKIPDTAIITTNYLPESARVLPSVVSCFHEQYKVSVKTNNKGYWLESEPMAIKDAEETAIALGDYLYSIN